MRAGPLRHRIEIQAATETRAADGAATLTWTTQGRRYASIDGLRGREFHESAATQARATHRIRMRHYPDLTTRDRIKFGDRIFELEHVRNIDERRELTECLAREEL